MTKTQLSKTISHALRHEPQQYGIILDRDGWVEFETLKKGILKNNPDFEDFDLDTVMQILEQSDKKRFEIQGQKIRALYGHSIDEKVTYPEAIPPEILYHATSPESLEAILKEGLKPVYRQYVHLSSDPELCLQAAKRKTKNPVLLKVDTVKALENGVKFFNPEGSVWLAEFIDQRYLKLE
jgi:putative RNA 2'-phosphotransferase